MKTILIHGYGTKINNKSRKYHNGGFNAFQSEIDSGDADLFHWGKEIQFNFFDTINPYKQFELYKIEKKIACSDYILDKLDKKIRNSKPSTIICHSLGSQLLINYLKIYGQAKFIKKIIFISSDASIKSLNNLKLNIEIHNYYCPWDNALISSFILNKNHKPIGLYPAKHKYLKNHFWPLWIPLNLHKSFQRDKFLKNKIIIKKNLSKNSHPSKSS